jgi:glycosyltransferase involved in cell wall biosynthesis
MDAPRPRVAMIVANDVRSDIRVRKMAVSAAAAGLETLVVGMSRSGEREEFPLAGARVVLVPTAWRMRNETRARLAAVSEPRELLSSKLRAKISRPAPSRRGMHVRALEHQLQQREVNAEIGRLRVRREAITGSDVLAKLKRRRAGHEIRALKREARRRQTKHETWLKRSTQRRQGPTHREEAIDAEDWRRYAGQFEDMELAIGPELDAFEPGLIHAHDFHVIGVAERAAARGRAAGRAVAWVYDAHEFVPGMATPDPVSLRSYVALEDEYAARANHVITVSEPLADLLVARHGYNPRPTVVRNVPLVADPETFAQNSIRRRLGLSPETPLIVYSGGVTPARGVATIVEALPMLPGVHAAFIAPAHNRNTQQLLALADELGVRGQVHLAPFVAPEHVPHYLADADLGVHPMLPDWINHRIALPNKVFEYIHSGLPLVVSDCDEMARWVNEHGVGEVFAAADPAALAGAIMQVLADRGRYTDKITPALLERFSWGAEQSRLLGLYGTILGRPLDTPDLTELDRHAPARRRMSIQLLDDGGPEAALQRESLGSANATVAVAANLWNNRWSKISPAAIVYGIPAPGAVPPPSGGMTRPIVVVSPANGRDPDLHIEFEPDSLFAGNAPLRDVARTHADRTAELLASDTVVGMTHSLELLAHHDTLRWLPVPVPHMAAVAVPKLRRRRYRLGIVDGAFDAPMIKMMVELSTSPIEVVQIRTSDLTPGGHPPMVDLLVDELRTGDISPLALLAMARGIPVCANLSDRARARAPMAAVPVYQLTTKTLSDFLLDISDLASELAPTGAIGREYVAAAHDPIRSASLVLQILHG